MTTGQVSPETSGVTTELFGSLGAEIEGMAGRDLRMRMVTIEPGGVFGALQDRKDRPGRGPAGRRRAVAPASGRAPLVRSTPSTGPSSII